MLSVTMLAACDAPSAPSEEPGYDPGLFVGGEGSLIYHWPLGKAIAIYVQPGGAPPGRDLRAAVRQAAEAWTDVLHYREFSVRLVDDPDAADVIVHFDQAEPLLENIDVQCPDVRARLFGSAGVTSFCATNDLSRLRRLRFVEGGRLSRALFDVEISSDTVLRIPTQARLTAIVAHELGHVLGIGAHSNSQSDLMFSAAPVVRPSAADASTLRWLLRRPAELRL